MRMQELAKAANAMKDRGKPSAKIRAFVHHGVQALALEDKQSTTEVESPFDGWEMRRTATGETIRYGSDGYTYHRE